MAEIKHSFTGGKMNKDLDERLVPNGEYRHAENIQVRTTDGGAAGAVQNLQGNSEIGTITKFGGVGVAYGDTLYSALGDSPAAGNQECVGSVADEKNDSAYFFVGTDRNLPSREQIIDNPGPKIFFDAIVEKSFIEPIQDNVAPVCVDWWALSCTYADAGSPVPVGDFSTINLSGLNADFMPRVGMIAAAYKTTNTNQLAETYGSVALNQARIKSVSGTTITLDRQFENGTVNADTTAFLFYTPEEDRVLNFGIEKKITGINIIDNLLFWTDGYNEPKKINIDRCKLSSVDSLDLPPYQHTKLFVTNPSNGEYVLISEVEPSVPNTDLKKEHVTVIKKSPTNQPTLTMNTQRRSGNINAFIGGAIFHVGGNPQPGNTRVIELDGIYNYLPNDILTFSDISDGDSGIVTVTATVTTSNVNANDDTIMTVVLTSVDPDLTQENTNWEVTLNQGKPLFELKLGRIGYRYKYDDGEYSTFSPWSELVFKPGAFRYTPSTGYNTGMTNNVREIVVEDFIPHVDVRPWDVKAVDILFKTTDNQNVYIIKTITREIDPEWEDFVDYWGANTGRIILTSELIHKVISSNQTLRSWDNVPRTAIAQEMVGNRLVFANYTQGYNVSQFVGLTQQIITNDIFNLSPHKSVKSTRSYKWGMVFSDLYGRQTPVLSSSYSFSNIGDGSSVTGDIVVPKDYCAKQNYFRLQQQWNEDPPSELEYVSYYVKETSSEYYNLVMDRWYDAEDGNIWLSFPSADRNKVDEDTYLILKNENGNQNAVLEEARYKIIAISDDVPEYVKLDGRIMGRTDALNNIDVYETDWTTDPPTTGLMQGNNGSSADGTPWSLKNTTHLQHPDQPFRADEGSFRGNTKWVRIVAKASGVEKKSKWHKVSRFDFGADVMQVGTWTFADFDVATSTYITKPFGDEIDFTDEFAQENIEVDYTVDPYSLVQWFLEYRDDVPESKPEFDGRFFVKIENNGIITSKITKQSNTDYQVTSTFDVAYISMDPDPFFENQSDFSEVYDSYDPSINNANPLAAEQGGLSGVNYTGGAWSDYGTGLNSTNWVRGFEFTGVEPNSPISDGTDNYSPIYSTDADSEANELNYKWWEVSGTGSLLLENDGYPVYGGPVGASTWQESFDMQNDQPYSESDNSSIIQDFWMAFDSSQGASKVFIDNAPVHHGMIEPGSISKTSDTQAISMGPSSGNSWYTTHFWNSGKRQNSGLFKGDISSSHFPGYNLLNNTYSGGIGEDPGALIVSGTLGGLTFSCLGSGSDVPGEFYGLRNALATGGTYFRFKDDPFKTVYKTIPIKTATYTFNLNINNPIGEDWIDADVVDSGTNTFPDLGLGINANDQWNGRQQTNYDIDLENDDFYNKRTSFVIWFRQIENGVFKKQFVSGDNGPWRGYGVETDVWDPRSAVAHNGSTSMTIEILKASPVSDNVQEEEQLPSSACWETEPKETTGLDIYYEGSSKWPLILNSSNIIPYVGPSSRVGEACIVTAEDRQTEVDGTITYTPVNLPINSFINNVSGLAIQIYSPGIVWEPGAEEILQLGDILKFHHSDGTITRSKILREVTVDEEMNVVEYTAETGAQPITLRCATLPGFSWLFIVANSSFNSAAITAANGFLPLENWRVSGSGVEGTEYQVLSSPAEENTEDQTGGGYMFPDDFIVMGLEAGSLIYDSWSSFDDASAQAVAANGPGFVWDGGAELGFGEMAINVLEFEITFTPPPMSDNAPWYELDPKVYNYPIDLAWFNCYAYGNGLETNRIRDDFNAPQIDNGVKVSTTFLDYSYEERGSGIIYSGLYNSISGTNNLNEFNMSEKITKDLNPAYGSIQSLKTRNTDIVVLCEDKVLKVIANKDAMYNADGNSQLVATNRVLGTAVPFAGDYGISKNPESLAWDQYRLYFADRQRGAVLRLSGDGLTPISNVGMREWFRDNLKLSKLLLGTFDVVNGEYNLTLNYRGDIEKVTDTTVSFNEASKGWVSFKSFVPETGVSITGNYITAKNKKIWKHYAPFTAMTPSNSFYNSPYESRIDVIFNDTMDVVKSFKSINYEGSRARVVIDDNAIFDGQNIGSTSGWWVESFSTDLDNGAVKDFINKENKWFNHIVGNELITVDGDGGSLSDNWRDNMDTSAFSTQGLGFATAISSDFIPDGDESGDGSGGEDTGGGEGEINVVDMDALAPWAKFTFDEEQTGLGGIKHKTMWSDVERSENDLVMFTCKLWIPLDNMPGTTTFVTFEFGDEIEIIEIPQGELFEYAGYHVTPNSEWSEQTRIYIDPSNNGDLVPMAGASIYMAEPTIKVLNTSGVELLNVNYFNQSTGLFSGCILGTIQSELEPYGEGSGTDTHSNVPDNTVATGTNDEVWIDGWREHSVNGTMSYSSWDYFPELEG